VVGISCGVARVRGRSAAVAVALALGTGLAGPAGGAVGLGPAAAGAQEGPLSVVVTPSTGLVEGQVVQVTVTGAGPSGFVGLVQCDAAVGPAPDLTILLAHCGNGADSQGGDGTRPFTVRSTFRTFMGTTVACGAAPADCTIGAGLLAGDRFGEAPIDVAPSPLVVDPSTDVADGEAVSVRVASAPGTTVTLAQCASPVGETQAASRCGTPSAVDVPASGLVTTSIALVAALDVDGPGGDAPVDCAAGTCAVASFDAGGARLAAVDVGFRQPLAMTLDPAGGYVGGTHVETLVTGWRDTTLQLRQCDASVVATHDLDGGPCSESWGVVGEGAAPRSLNVLLARMFTGADGSAVTCGDAPDDCVIAVGAGPADQFLARPISFDAQPVATVTPSTGLSDGQEVSVAVSGLVPGAAYQVLQCNDEGNVFGCEDRVPGTEVVASPAGELATTLVVTQQLSAQYRPPMYCRDTCHVGVVPAGREDIVAWVPIALSAGAITATPDDGLVDGQPVTVTTDGVQPSYAGPPFWIFSSGLWALGQCDRAVVDDPTVAAVFAHCTVPPGGGAVTVPPGPSPSPPGFDVDVLATVTPFLGGPPTDCTSAVGACVLVLTRVEQDGSLSLLTTPLSFAAGP
jgi:hypothetical protein